MKLIFLFFLTMLSACATRPFHDLPPDKKLSQAERIGVLIDVNDKPTHRHAGANPFIADYDRPYSFDWKLTQYIEDQFAEKIRVSTKFQFVNLKDYGLKREDVAELVIAGEKEYALNFRKDKIITRLKGELGLRTIIVFGSRGGSMVNTCLQFSCRMSENIHTGLYTTAGVLTFRPVSDVSANIYILDDPVDLAHAWNVIMANGFRIPALKKYARPEDIKSLTEQDWAPIRAAVELSIDQYIDEVVKELLLNTQS